MRLIQYRQGDRPAVAVLEDGAMGERLAAASLYDLAWDAISRGVLLTEAVLASRTGEPVDARELVREGLLALPVTHADPAHCLVTGTGLTHLGSAAGRDAMHRKALEDEAATDSMKMFRMGLEGGKPAAGSVGVQPEWFYKGDGSTLRASGEALASPGFAQDGGEEPEIAGVYLVGPDGTPFRLGFCLANEFSDHVTEKGNYLWLAHSKLRNAALGPELFVGELPDHVEGVSRIRRGGQTVFEKPFLSGEANMSHSIANLEHHHFKYDLFRRPGDLHIHFFGTATLSFSDGFAAKEGDVFEIEAAPFLLPLTNALRLEAERGLQMVRAL
ncbi:AraD1 family protein [Aureimonas mangrovi]|uniref:AraD1 family protein n=1 Tax=Aureimonas mangrovi TaxID=2758041 RepID=UPI00163D9D23|nr:AraD1 family protein [Aureimonas mangrovi]